MNSCSSAKVCFGVPWESLNPFLGVQGSNYFPKTKTYLCLCYSHSLSHVQQSFSQNDMICETIALMANKMCACAFFLLKNGSIFIPALQMLVHITHINKTFPGPEMSARAKAPANNKCGGVGGCAELIIQISFEAKECFRMPG